jgi:hypothetical protein
MVSSQVAAINEFRIICTLIRILELVAHGEHGTISWQFSLRMPALWAVLAFAAT